MNIYAKAVTSLFIKLLTAALNFIVALLLARGLGAEEYGYYAYALALVAVLAVPAQFGFPSLVVKEISRSASLNNTRYLADFWGWAKKQSLTISLIVVIFSEIIAYCFFSDVRQYYVLAIALLLIPFITLLSLYSSYMRGLKKIVLGQIFEPFLRFLFLVIFVAVALVFFEDAIDALYSAGFHLLAAFLATLVLLIAAWKIAPETGLDNAVDEPLKKKMMWLTVWPMAITGGIQIMNANLDVLVINYFSDKGSVGIYKITVQVTALLAFGLQAINLIIAPYFSSLYQQKNFKALQEYSKISARISVGFSIITALPLVVFSNEILVLAFGETFRQGATALVFLLIGQVVNAFFGSVGVLLNMTGHHGSVAKLSTVAFFINFSLNVWLVPIYGIEGAAIATAATLVLWNISLNICAKRKLGISTAAIFL